jgi:hypothetical protein
MPASASRAYPTQPAGFGRNLPKISNFLELHLRSLQLESGCRLNFSGERLHISEGNEARWEVEVDETGANGSSNANLQSHGNATGSNATGTTTAGRTSASGRTSTGSKIRAFLGRTSKNDNAIPYYAKISTKINQTSWWQQARVFLVEDAVGTGAGGGGAAAGGGGGNNRESVQNNDNIPNSQSPASASRKVLVIRIPYRNEPNLKIDIYQGTGKITDKLIGSAQTALSCFQGKTLAMSGAMPILKFDQHAPLSVFHHKKATNFYDADKTKLVGKAYLSIAKIVPGAAPPAVVPTPVPASVIPQSQPVHVLPATNPAAAVPGHNVPVVAPQHHNVSIVTPQATVRVQTQVVEMECNTATGTNVGESDNRKSANPATNANVTNADVNPATLIASLPTPGRTTATATGRTPPGVTGSQEDRISTATLSSLSPRNTIMLPFDEIAGVDECPICFEPLYQSHPAVLMDIRNEGKVSPFLFCKE